MTTEFVRCGDRWLNLAHVTEVRPSSGGAVMVHFSSRDQTEVKPPDATALIERLAALHNLRLVLAANACRADDALAEALVGVTP